MKKAEPLSRRLHQLEAAEHFRSAAFSFIVHRFQNIFGFRLAAYRKTKRLSPVDAAYIAGLIDGEGSISLSRKHKLDNRQLVVSIANTERCLLTYMERTTGVGKITRKRTAQENHTPSMAYTVTNRQALDLLRQVAPFLRSYKAMRAELVLKDYIQVTPRNGRYSSKQATEREAFVEKFFAIHAGSRRIRKRQ